MADRKFYVTCELGCKFESMTKEQIYTAIMQAVNEGTISNIDAGFITTVKTINGKALKFFVGEQSEYEALSAGEREGLFAIITNDSTKEGLLKALDKLQKDYAEMHDGLLDGSFVVAKAKAIDNTEKYFASVGTSGVKVEKITEGRTYIITAILDESNASNVVETVLLSVPTENSINAIHSTPTRGGFYARCVMNSVPELFFENSAGTRATARKVTIREI